MYTLKVDILNNETNRDFIRALQAMAQESPVGTGYEFEMGIYFSSVTLETTDIKTVKRLVDIIESEEFMREQN